MGMFDWIVKPNIKRMEKRKDASSLLRALKHNDADIRKQAAQALGNIGEPSVMSSLVRTLKDKSAEVRRAAISSIEQYWWTGDPKIIEKLVLPLKDEDREVRKLAALAIGEYIPKLNQNWQSDEHQFAYHGVGLGLKEFEKKVDLYKKVWKKAEISLIQALQDEDQEVVIEVVSSLANIQSVATVKPVYDSLKGRDMRIIKAAREAIDRLKPSPVRKAMKGILEILENSQGEQQDMDRVNRILQEM